MRLLGTKTEKSHSLYLIIFQAFKSIFLIKNETLRLFSQKNFWLFANFGAHSAQLQNSLRKFYIKC